MLLHRSSSVFHFYRLSVSLQPKLLSHFDRSYFVLSHSTLSLTQSHAARNQRFSTTTAAAAAAGSHENGASDTFFAEEDVSWTSIGLSNNLSRALSSFGLHRPSSVQAAAIPQILQGNDVVIAAETGSGKTHAYLAPIINKLCADDSTAGDSLVSDQGSNSAPARALSLVLCPNVLLCEQIVQMASGLCDDDGNPLNRIASVCGRQGWPVNEPDIIVSTPAALLNNIEPRKHRRLNFMRSVRCVVFDEADMLLCGGFQNQVIRLIHMLRFDEKQLSRSSPSNKSVSEISEEQEDLQNESTSEEGEDSVVNVEGEEEDSVADVEEEEEDSVADVEEEEERGGIESVSNERKGWRRVIKTYMRSKQYIFVAATLPLNGKKTAGAVLKRMFPDASWVNGNYLHCHNPRLEQKWIQVTVDTQVDALIEAVNQGFKPGVSNHGAGISRTMVFANTVEAAEAVCKILESAGIECYRYHKDCTLEDRAKTLVDFREKGGIFVCTDAAAHGVDVPNVSHVIQEPKSEICAEDVTERISVTDECPGSKTMELVGLGSVLDDNFRKHTKQDNKDSSSCTLEFDGASKGNPGPAGAGAVLKNEYGSVICRLREGLGTATNNAAEYRALILGLKYALKEGYKKIHVRGDSKLVCNQVQGLWRARHESMSVLHKQAKILKDDFLSFEISHVLRALNSDADAQANLAVKLDDGEIEEEWL